MKPPPFHDELSLADTAEALGKQAMQLGLIKSFFVRFFPDSRQFFIPDQDDSAPLPPEQAYMQFKRMISQANPQPVNSIDQSTTPR
jgi:hypothetical protein